ncbi:hypothetical protein FOMPIDRAFT_146399 [Fomitopsis schrenkii]|uniref:Cytochrome P450 n=1 Tax=Fomitopsis schrenkii TaxID=2126942 RepID=S8F1C9_FOMSC|nr:hypothetical protein FOMPIDRAFT_146399 [Fomitopsis schrenkii]
MLLGILDSFLLALFFYLLYKACGRLNARSVLSLPPGPRRLPIIGSIHHLPLANQHVAFMNWKETYGDIVYVQIFNRPSIVLNSAKAMEELLNKRGSRYSDRPDTILVTEVLGFTHNVALMHYGDQWRRHRRWFQTAFQTTSALESYVELQHRESMRLVSDIIGISHDSEKKTGLEIGNTVFSALKRYVGSLMLEIAYGHPVSSLDDEFIVLADSAISGSTETGAAASSLIDFFPILRYVPAWLPGAGFRKKIDEVHELVRQMIEIPFERVYEAMRNGNARPCFLTKLLDDCTIDGKLSDDDRANIKCAATIVYGAGTDTTATTLTTLMLVLAQYQDVQKKAQEEIDKVTGSERLPHFEDRASMPYMEALIKEVYRWNPPFPLGMCSITLYQKMDLISVRDVFLFAGLPHRVAEADTYGSYSIPAGTMIIPNIWAVLRDPTIYSEPEVFKPERFLSEKPEREPQDFVFGFGRRVCVGQQFADASIWLAIIRILATFDITKARDPTTGAEVSIAPEFASGMIRHLHPFPFDIKPRTSKATELLKREQEVE